MNKLELDLGERKYNILIEENFNNIADEIKGRFTKGLIVTDSNVGKVYLKPVCDFLKSCFKELNVFEFDAGEKSKNINTVQKIYDSCMKFKMDRKSCIIALGGGVTGDMAGFAASTFMRGIGFVQVPTSLLAQTDSSVGGKVGIDYNGAKNIVGAFKQPDLVYICTKTLDTLSAREFSAGMAEVIKYSVIRDIDFLGFLEEKREKIKNLSHDCISEMIYMCCKIKADVVMRDETEQSLRMILNFGHTVGHGIESAKNFELLHGECVGLGMICAMDIAVKRGMIDNTYAQRVKNVLASYNLPVCADNLDESKVIEYMKKDKKAVSDNLVFVLPVREGEVEIVRDVSDEEIKNSLIAIRK